MTTLGPLLPALPLRRFAPGEVLAVEGARESRLYILETGSLTVTREGVTLAIIDEPGALVGEMSVLLGIPQSATVRALTAATARLVEDVLGTMSEHPDLAIHIATTACARLDATSALLVELRREQQAEPALVARIMKSLMGPRSRRVDHE